MSKKKNQHTFTLQLGDHFKLIGSNLCVSKNALLKYYSPPNVIIPNQYIYFTTSKSFELHTVYQLGAIAG